MIRLEASGPGELERGDLDSRTHASALARGGLLQSDREHRSLGPLTGRGEGLQLDVTGEADELCPKVLVAPGRERTGEFEDTVERDRSTRNLGGSRRRLELPAERHSRVTVGGKAYSEVKCRRLAISAVLAQLEQLEGRTIDERRAQRVVLKVAQQRGASLGASGAPSLLLLAIDFTPSRVGLRSPARLDVDEGDIEERVLGEVDAPGASLGDPDLTALEHCAAELREPGGGANTLALEHLEAYASVNDPAAEDGLAADELTGEDVRGQTSGVIVGQARDGEEFRPLLRASDNPLEIKGRDDDVSVQADHRSPSHASSVA
ncbi:hypothetical protein [Plesiocystis pacifica]|uniref:hypothetical protein n=1 Tax=Plesiocystis pacifica TaxID=191768 RepID=UPI0012FBF601|nr:hypothetical protein [Plesiocystis pacifica]